MNRFFTILVITIVLAGCHSTVNTTSPAENRAGPTVIKDKRIITDGSLVDKAGVVDVRETTVAGDLLKVQVQMYNSTSSLKSVNYRFEWFDSDGMRIETVLSRWKPKMLYGKETVWVSAVAPTPKTVDFRFKLMEAKD